jgi:hypothetical protein
MKSRRVYKLSKETQKVLEHTKLDGITWEDFKLPFECFGIELADPLSNPFGVSSDFILVSQTELTSLSRGPERKDIHIIGLTEDLRSFNRKSKFVDAAAVESVPSRKEMKKELVLLQQGMRRFIRPDAYRTVVPEGKLSKYLTELPENVEEELSISQDDRMLRIVLGLSLYLESLSPNSKAISASEVKIFLSGKDKSAIIDPAEVLRVNTVSPLTRDEKIFLGLEGTKEQRREIQMCCHWRAGHWRRPPGKGSDPSFPKTVHIPPTLVRRDRLPENALPGGAIKGI